MILTVDIGNSRVKWASWQTDVIVARGVSDYLSKHCAESTVEKITGVLDKLFSVVEKPERVLTVCVGDESMRLLLSDWVQRHWQLDVEYLKTEKQYKGITNAYDVPEQHGVDRWAGVVAAHQAFPDVPVCVIGAGTAITFDLVSEKGQHLGGYILPSFKTMHAALMSDTANVASSSGAKYQEEVIPNNTDDAVNQGLHQLIRAGIRELCQSAQNNLGSSMQIVITGGSAKNILQYSDLPVMHHLPDLVMQGLYDIMKLKKH